VVCGAVHELSRNEQARGRKVPASDGVYAKAHWETPGMLHTADERLPRGGTGLLARASSRARGVGPLVEGTRSPGLGRAITNGCVGGKYNQGCGAPASGHRDMTKVTQCAMLTDYRARAILGTHHTS